MSAIDYVSSGNPSTQKPPLGAPPQPALCLDTKDVELFASVNGKWQSVSGSGGSSSNNYNFLQLQADGVTDNSATINSAIASLPADGGTIQLIPVGTGYCYCASSVNINVPGVVLRGTSSAIQETNLGNCVLQFAAGIPGIVVTAVSVLIENLTLLSKDAGVTAGDHGLWINGAATSPTVRNVSVRHFGSNGFMLDSSSSGNVDHWRLTCCLAYENYGDGFQFNAGTDTNVGMADTCNATSNGGWGFNIIAGAAGNTFLEPHVSSNATGGYQVASSSNFFHNVYAESASVSSFIFTSTADNNIVFFNVFGQPTTITNSGGLSNTFFYNQGSIPGYANFAINSQTPGSGHSYKFTNGSFNGNDLAISDDTGATWMDFNFSLNTLNALKEFDATNFAAATSGGSTNSGKIGFYSSYWTGAVSATDKWTLQVVGGTGTDGTSTLTLTHTGTTGAATLDLEGVAVATSASIGSNGAAPAQVAGYLAITINGTAVKIPYYLP